MQLAFAAVCIACVVGDSVSAFSYEFRHFETVYQWSYINFTWDSLDIYQKAINTLEYIPENIMLGGIKFYKESMFVALPKHRRGVPVTLTYLSLGDSQRTNRLLTPYPSWDLNDDKSCYNLQSMLSMEIDTRGIMWALDGVRLTNNVECPPKLELMDLNKHGERIQTYIFPNEICLQNGGFLNDIVIDETSGGFTYITDNSNIDPGLIIYSRYQNRAWKIRDQTMFGENYATNFIVNNYVFSQMGPIDGIALSPKSSNRTLYYSSLTAYSLYGIDTGILKNEELCRSNVWRKQVRFIGVKEGQTDGMMMDSRGDLYYTLMSHYGVGKWNIFEPIGTSEVVYTNRKKLDWPDGFGMDQKGFLYLINSRAYTFLDPRYILRLTPDIKFGVFKLYTGTRSYLYNDIDNDYYK